MDGILSHQGGFPSKKREIEGKQKGINKGSKKARGLRHVMLPTYIYSRRGICNQREKYNQ